MVRVGMKFPIYFGARGGRADDAEQVLGGMLDFVPQVGLLVDFIANPQSLECRGHANLRLVNILIHLFYPGSVIADIPFRLF